jgi:anti-sigma regulatory factor (Ser/Thr protein kinase)
MFDLVPVGTDNRQAMCWRRSFSGDPREARKVRRLVEVLLVDCAAVHEIVFTANEFFCNAVEHTESRRPGGQVHLELRLWEDKCVAVSVTDDGGIGEPRVCTTSVNRLAENGYGLAAISGTASSWGWHGNEQGRTVTAVFML